MNDINRIHDNKVNNISERNLLHDKLNTSKHTKNMNIHYSTIKHGCMNTRKGRRKFDKFQILSDSECSSMIILRGLIITT